MNQTTGQTFYDFQATRINGESEALDTYRGQVVLVVNTASKCGFTPQYEGLERLYQRFRERGFSLLGFPCNQFRQQEPGDADQIQQFCATNYGVTFPLFAKIEVNGAGAHPLYRWLKAAAPGVLGSQRIKWNFTKFLVDPQGRVVRRYASVTKPEQIAADIDALLPA